MFKINFLKRQCLYHSVNNKIINNLVNSFIFYYLQHLERSSNYQALCIFRPSL